MKPIVKERGDEANEETKTFLVCLILQKLLTKNP